MKFDTVVGAPPYFFGRKGPHVNYEELRERLLASGNAYVVDYSETDIQLRPAGRVTQLSAMTADVSFGDLLSLSLVEAQQADGTLSAELQWQLNDAVSNDFTVFVHLYDANGQLVSQADGDLLRGVHYTPDHCTTQSLVMRSKSGTVRQINAQHALNKLDSYSIVDY